MKTFLAVCLVLFAGLMVIGRYSEEDPAARDRRICADGKVDAFVMSQTFVTQRLRSPSTASYPYISSDGVSVRQNGCDFVVNAYVDAQNGFGGTVRSRYTVDLSYEGSNRWQAGSVRIY